MKKLFRLIFLLIAVIILNACNNQTTITPTTILTEKQTKLPTSLPIETPTQKATATEVIPTLIPRQQEFFELGYDKLSSLKEGVVYGILDENSVQYMPDGGIKFGDGYVLSTMEVSVYNPITKIFERYKIVADWSIEDGFGSYYRYAIDVGGGVVGDAVILPQALTKNFREQYFAISPGKQPFIKLIFNQDVPGFNEFFQKSFPEFTGKIQTTNIPSIGKVLVIKGILPEGFPGW